MVPLFEPEDLCVVDADDTEVEAEEVEEGLVTRELESLIPLVGSLVAVDFEARLMLIGFSTSMPAQELRYSSMMVTVGVGLVFGLGLLLLFLVLFLVDGAAN